MGDDKKKAAFLFAIGPSIYKLLQSLIAMTTGSTSAQSFYTTYVHVNVSENVIKMKNSLLANFEKIWLKILYYTTGSLAQFLSKFKNL